MAVRLTREQMERMTAQAQAEAPNECCGLLLGRGDVVQEVFPGRNVDKSPRTYLMEPQDQLRAFRLMDERGWELIGIYHSHPQTLAYPSKTDLARALYPDARYMIISLLEPSAPKGWFMRALWAFSHRLIRMVRGPAYPRVRAFRIVDQTDGNGAPVRDREGNSVKVVTEERVSVTRK